MNISSLGFSPFQPLAHEIHKWCHPKRSMVFRSGYPGSMENRANKHSHITTTTIWAPKQGISWFIINFAMLISTSSTWWTSQLQLLLPSTSQSSPASNPATSKSTTAMLRLSELLATSTCELPIAVPLVQNGATQWRWKGESWENELQIVTTNQQNATLISW